MFLKPTAFLIILIFFPGNFICLEYLRYEHIVDGMYDKCFVAATEMSVQRLQQCPQQAQHVATVDPLPASRTSQQATYARPCTGDSDTSTIKQGDNMNRGEDVTNETSVDQLMHQLQHIFQGDKHIVIGWTDERAIKKISGQISDKSRYDVSQFFSGGANHVTVISKVKKDLTCLLPSPVKDKPTVRLFEAPFSLEAIVDYINVQCDVFKSPTGALLSKGRHRNEVLENVFRMSSISNLTMGMLYGTCDNPLNSSFSWNGASLKQQNCDPQHHEQHKQPHHHNVTIPRCERIASLSREDFFNNYLKKSRPVIIEGGISQWKAFKKWTVDYLEKEYGKKKVHIKLAPGGNFEGVEKADLWENYQSFQMPQLVRSKLPYPDLVVVRPASLSMKLQDFLQLIHDQKQLKENVSAYLEYSSIPDYLPALEDDIEELPFINGLLKKRSLNLWLSNGNTLGKLHFDPFDNLLCQIRGRKQVILFEPFDSSQLYEGHIPEAMLKFNSKSGKFQRKALVDSTSMVMSPVDILKPNFERFPRFGSALPYNCTIREGDVLFLPSFWWHEVQSFPSDSADNLAINFWYEPFLSKTFPCEKCKMDVNLEHYRHLL